MQDKEGLLYHKDLEINISIAFMHNGRKFS